MTLLHIDTGGEMRGGQYQVLLLIKALRDEGHHTILLAKRGGRLFEAARREGFDVESAHARQVWRWSREVEMVHAHDARAHTLAALACRSRFVVSRRVAFPVRRSLASGWKYRRAARFLAVSQFVATQLQAAGVKGDKIDVVYDAVPGRTPAIWNANYPAVALASRDPQKGRDLVEQAAMMANIAVNFSENLESDLQQASMFVYLSRSEGLGSAALLAMSMGIPVIASRVGGLMEVFKDRISGIFVANEPAEIARAMRCVKEDEAMVRNLIGAAHKRIAERFTTRQLVHGTLAAYRSALDH